MSNDEEATMAMNNYLLYWDRIDSGEIQEEEKILEYKKEAEYWHKQYIKLTQNDKGLLNELGFS